MNVTVGDVMREVRNYFPHHRIDGDFAISRGVLTPGDLLAAGDWIAIGGSLRNSGVHQLEEGGRVPDARDEQWQGTVWLLSPPPAFLALCEEIAAWAQVHPACHKRRESFGAYSHEALVDDNGVPMSWQTAFAAQLIPYRRMFTGVKPAC